MYRREFIKYGSIAASGIALSSFAGSQLLYGAPSDKVRVALAGTNSRGTHVGKLFAKTPNVEVVAVIDPDKNVAEKTALEIQGITNKKLVIEKDIRKMLEMKNIDALMIATPDHWHAPMAIMAAAAKKHVYVEKPCSHNPNEGEIAISAARKHNIIMQMGNQRRSFPGVNQMINDVKSGIIGRPYFAKAWYTNNRKPTYIKPGTIPANLDWELWQGPAPRREYKDGYVHYNWHWFWHWGTGEALNNGTHEIDIARWALGVNFPTKVVSAGGRYQWKDDWETPDTQTITYEFDNNTAISWEGRSCNAYKYFEAGRGVILYGDKGTIVYPGGDAYKVYDYDEKLVKEVKEGQALDLTNTVSATAGLDQLHVQNFVDAIRGTAKHTSDIEEGHKSVLLCQLGNIALRTGKTLYCDTANGKPKDADAMKLWSREYEKGWEPKY
ncbi:MAG: Gfo/Idh/MocA family oxidoreductase [Cytophagales bacterium]|nr:Gfo/Idh/MocA family oxidoreductase [Cytophagales bacterium]